MNRISWAMDDQGLVHAFGSEVMRDRWVMENPGWGAQPIPARAARIVTGPDPTAWLRTHPACDHMGRKRHLSL